LVVPFPAKAKGIIGDEEFEQDLFHRLPKLRKNG
jgi:hypothetical protein